MNKEELLEAVQQHKDNCVSAMISRDPAAKQKTEDEAKKFLADNYAQVLDILDDALTFVINGGSLYGKG